MSTCPKCSQQSDGNSKKSMRLHPIFKWFGFYSHCNHCDRLYFRLWDNKSLAMIILSVVLFQFLTSLLVFPALTYFVGAEGLRIVLFTLFHLACLPFYTLLSVSFMLNYR